MAPVDERKIQDGNPARHRVMFVREDKGPVVLDSKKGLRTNVRRDFGRMRPSIHGESVFPVLGR
ncbi:hypothetical protein Y981_00230 [Leptospirillum ferriphilum YSK]|uniref:Uncharacterized protein n=1 Tax=Leptospirillum ferriphilum YSK TaxID=1441628 RepID=A0A059XW91_9BACT|nr:hypothetical protein Y981_00230 [Leptospirillum ferriphilum YSK]